MVRRLELAVSSSVISFLVTLRPNDDDPIAVVQGCAGARLLARGLHDGDRGRAQLVGGNLGPHLQGKLRESAIGLLSVELPATSTRDNASVGPAKRVGGWPAGVGRRSLPRAIEALAVSFRPDRPQRFGPAIPAQPCRWPNRQSETSPDESTTWTTRNSSSAATSIPNPRTPSAATRGRQGARARRRARAAGTTARRSQDHNQDSKHADDHHDAAEA